jgi:superfamily I DNA/RNA helicase
MRPVPNPFVERPIVNSPYEYPRRHWELEIRSDTVNVATMHLVKGLEFRDVAVMACDAKYCHCDRIENVGDDGDLHDLTSCRRP